jgi:RHS repeat-associated protein
LLSLCVCRNQQYSITALTDGGGSIVERYAYTAYGQVTFANASGTVQSTSASNNRYAYTGREWDQGLSLYHYRARMYDAEIGRFVSRDPIGFEGSQWSLYEYVSSSPSVYNDPTGMFLGWGYGNYCDWSLRGQSGPPIDALDRACKKHDRCQSTVLTANPCHILYCSLQLCLDAYEAQTKGCLGDPDCQRAAQQVRALFCAASLTNPEKNLSNPWNGVIGPKL